MAIQSAFYFTDGTTRTFPSTKHIASSVNVAVWMKRVIDDIWEATSYELWTLANNSIVFTVAPQSTVYSQIELRIADEADELIESPSNTALVAGSIVNVNTVATNIASVNTTASSISAIQNTSANATDISVVSTNISAVQTVSTNNINITTVSASIANVNAVGADLLEPISEINTVATDITNVNIVSEAITNVNTNATNIANINSVATTIVPNIAEILLADDNAVIATTKAGEAQLSKWEAEAERLTADSYATEAEDTFVKLVTSDGDGTFTYTPTAEYSALHWAAKSMSGDIAPIIHAATAKPTPVDADEFAITDSAATFGLKKLTWANIKTTLGALFAPLEYPALVNPTINGVAQSGYTGFKNFIINGNFAVNQYANIDTAITAVNNTYQIDRQKNNLVIVTATIQRLTAQTVNGIVSNTLKFVATSTDTGYLGSQQYVENFHKGETLTESVWVKSNSVNARIFIYDGVTYTVSNPHTGDGTYQLLTVTKTISTSATSLQCFVGLTSSIGGNVSITTGNYVESTMWQLESGIVATPFEQEDKSTTWKRCRYYARKSYNEITPAGTISPVGAIYFHNTSTATHSVLGGLPFGEPMRVTPTVTIYSPSTGVAGKVRNASDNTDENASLYTFGQYGNGYVLFGVAPVANKQYAYQYFASAEL